MREIVIFGAGGLGELVLDILLQSSRYRPVAFLDSDKGKHGTAIDGVPVIGGMEMVAAIRESGVRHAIAAIGIPRVRIGVAEQLTQQGMTLVSAIHPLSSVAPSAKLGEHLIICARSTVCVHATVGDHSILLSGSIVEHDNRLGKGVVLHPAVRLAGGVTIGDLAVLEIGACVIPYRTVGRGARVEPGSVVIRDVLPGTTVGGAPAFRTPPSSSSFVATPPDGAATLQLACEPAQHSSAP